MNILVLSALDLPLPMLSSPLSNNRQSSASNVHSEIGNGLFNY